MKRIVMTNQKMIELDKHLAEAGTLKANPEFSMAIAFNRHILKPFISALESASEPSARAKEFIDTRNRLIVEHGEQIGGGKFAVSTDRIEEFNSKLNPIAEEYKADIDEYDEQINKFDKEILPSVANDGNPIELHELPKNAPDGISGNTLFGLIDLIKA